MRANTSTVKRVLNGILPGLFLAAITFMVFFTTLVVKIRSFYVFPDNIDQFYAWYQKLAYAVHSGVLPIWDANVSAGHSFVGELQAGVFYPINLLWVWLFGSSAGISMFWLELIVVFHFWLASMGMYLAARAIGLRKYSSLIAGLAYAFGGGVAMRSVSQTAIFFGICYIPWAFFWFQKWLQTKSKWNLLWCGVFLGFSILSGHIDPWYFACVIIALSVVFTAPHPSFESWARTVVRRFAGVAAVVVISMIVALPQLALSAQYLPQAVRFVGDAQPIGPNQRVSTATFISTFSFKPPDVLSVVDPGKYPVVDGNEIYVGLTGLGIVLTAVFVFRKSLRRHPVWRRYGPFIIGTSGVASIIMIGYWTFIPAVLRYLPLFSQIRQLARYSIIVQFCLALAVGICAEVVVANLAKLPRGKRQKVIALGSSIGLIGFLGLNALYLYLIQHRAGDAINKHFVYQSIILFLAVTGCLLVRKWAHYVLVGALALTAISAPVWFMPRIDSFKSTYPPNYYKRTASITYLEQYYGQARVLIENNALPVNIGDVYNIQTVGGYGATLHESFYKYLNEADIGEPSGQHMNYLNVRFVVSKKAHPELKKVLTDQARHLSVYERPDYLPRAYFADQAQACVTHQASCTPIKITNYSDAHIGLMYNSDKAQKLVVSEIEYDGWQAKIDGKKIPIDAFGPDAVQPFRSVNVPAGVHHVTFDYKPYGL